MWKIAARQRVKSFIWRACLDILPSRDKFLKRRIVDQSGCERCGSEESEIHALCYYQVAKDV